MESDATFRKRVQPEPRASGPKSVPLSILDSTVVRFAPAGAIWIYDHGLKNNAKDLVGGLEQSFVKTLGDFPQWAGQLHWAPYQKEGSHSHRFNRAMVTFGADSDPGVEWSVVRLAMKPEDIVPGIMERCSAGNGRVWVADSFPQSALHSSSTPLALSDAKTYKELPGMLVQVTLLEEGGFAVAVKMSHPLADASSLLLFMHHWAAASRLHFRCMGSSELVTSDTKPLARPVFEPQLLDACASGNIDGPSPRPDLIRQAMCLPLHRYDWWATETKGFPVFLADQIHDFKPIADPDLLEQAQQEQTTPPPWQTWDMTQDVSHAVIHFAGPRVIAMNESAKSASPGTKISRLDTLLSTVWAAINRARGLSEDDGEVFLNMTLGTRARVHRPLPEGFLGSPLFMGHVKATGREASAFGSTDQESTAAGNGAALPCKIRSCLNTFDPEAVGALLHDAAFQVSPQRIWQAFLGQRHTLVTSWRGLGTNDVDFIGGGETNLPRYAHPIMPRMDGCLQVMDSATNDGGIDVSLCLEAEAMRRLQSDPELNPE